MASAGLSWISLFGVPLRAHYFNFPYICLRQSTPSTHTFTFTAVIQTLSSIIFFHPENEMKTPFDSRVSEALILMNKSNKNKKTKFSISHIQLLRSVMFPPSWPIWCNKRDGPTARPVGQIGGHARCNDTHLCNMHLKPIVFDLSPLVQLGSTTKVGPPFDIHILCVKCCLFLCENKTDQKTSVAFGFPYHE